MSGPKLRQEEKLVREKAPKGGRNFLHTPFKRLIMYIRYQNFAKAGKFPDFAQFSEKSRKLIYCNRVSKSVKLISK